MIESIEQLRGMRGNYATYEDLVMRCCDIADEIEHEVEERYIERPIDADGMVIALDDNMFDQNGEQFIVSSIELLASGEWLVYRKGTLGSEFANLCHHKMPTVEDVLREFFDEYDSIRGYTPDENDVLAKFAAKLQLKEAE